MIKKISLIATIFFSILLVVGCSNTNSKSINKDATVSFEKLYSTSDEDVEKLKLEAESRGKKVHLNLENEGNLLLLIETTGTIKDIRINELGEEYISNGFDLGKYLENYSNFKYTPIRNFTLNKDNALIVKIYEPETIPSYFISWIDELGDMGCYLVSYGVDANGEEIIKEHVKINKEKVSKSLSNKLENILLNNYWVNESINDENGYSIDLCDIYSIKKDMISGYTNDESEMDTEFYYPIEDINEEDGVIKIKSLFEDNNGSRIVNYTIKIVNDKEIKIIDDMRNEERIFKKKTIKELVDLAYVKYYISFSDESFQDFINKTENELYNIANIEFETDSITDNDINFIYNTISEQGALDAVFSSKAKGSANVAHDDIYVTKFGNKYGYVITLREYGSDMNIAIGRVFLDVKSGNIYDYDLGLCAIKTDRVIDTININDFKNTNKKSNESSLNKKLYSIDQAKEKATEILESKELLYSGDEIFSVEDTLNKNDKLCYTFGITSEYAELDFRILIEKETLEAVFMYSDGSFVSIDEM